VAGSGALEPNGALTGSISLFVPRLVHARESNGVLHLKLMPKASWSIFLSVEQRLGNSAATLPGNGTQEVELICRMKLVDSCECIGSLVRGIAVRHEELVLKTSRRSATFAEPHRVSSSRHRRIHSRMSHNPRSAMKARAAYVLSAPPAVQPTSLAPLDAHREQPRIQQTALAIVCQAPTCLNDIEPTSIY